MKIIIGIIKNEKDKIEACRVYDTTSISYADISYQKIRSAITKGQRIVGYKPNNKFATSIRKEAASYSLDLTPQLSGSGKLITNEEECLKTLIGWTGFAENKHYIVVNWDGTLTMLSQQEFKEKVINRKINGARYNNMYDKYCLTPDLNNELDIDKVLITK